jgi:hypothetical protein
MLSTKHGERYTNMVNTLWTPELLDLTGFDKATNLGNQVNA